MAVSSEDLMDEFSFFGIDIDDENILDKLKELCTVHRKDASGIAAEWTAFSQSKKQIAINLETLNQLDRERLGKKSQKTPKTPHTKKEKMPVLYDINTLQKGIDENDAETLYNAYSGNTPKSVPTQKRQHTPENVAVKRFTNSVRSPMVPFSPASYSPAGATPSKKFSSRTNAGEVLTTFGDINNVSWQGEGQGCIVSPFGNMEVMTTQFKYMFQKLTEKAHVLNDMIEDMAQQLEKRHGIEEFSHLALPIQEQITVVGRVCCDSDGKLNAKSVLLEGSRETSAGKCIPVDLSELKEYSLFPGQIVAMDGLNNTGRKLVAKNLYTSVQLPLPDVTVKTEPDAGRLSVLIAVGPFTTSDNLSYEPLLDLMKYVNRDKPDVCIFLGPFVDVKNEEIDKGNCKVSYEEVFISNLKHIENITKSCGSQVVVVPSYRDVHHDYVYPQPPFFDEKIKGNKASSHMHFVSDPSTVSVNNVVFGITSTDILFHIGAEEISYPPGGIDRLGRLTQHIIAQQSYYPLYPPSEEVNIDYESFEKFGRMAVTPHILIVPSDLKYFIKDVKGCCCVNPGRVAKGQIGGTFARLVINTNNMTSNTTIVKNVAGQVLRV